MERSIAELARRVTALVARDAASEVFAASFCAVIATQHLAPYGVLAALEGVLLGLADHPFTVGPDRRLFDVAECLARPLGCFLGLGGPRGGAPPALDLGGWLSAALGPRQRAFLVRAARLPPPPAPPAEVRPEHARIARLYLELERKRGEDARGRGDGGAGGDPEPAVHADLPGEVPADGLGGGEGGRPGDDVLGAEAGEADARGDVAGEGLGRPVAGAGGAGEEPAVGGRRREHLGGDLGSDGRETDGRHVLS